jgi:hypothetical protein
MHEQQDQAQDISMLRRLAEHVFIPEKQAGDVSRGTSLKSTAARQAIAR